MAGENILIVDDEKEIGDIVSMYLHKEGFTTTVSLSGNDAINKARTVQPDLILLDVFLPDMDGFEVCRSLRTFTEKPILFLSCKDSEFDKVIGLHLGADDYISKPFRPYELIARIRANLRRNRVYDPKQKALSGAKTGAGKEVLISRSLKLDVVRHEAFLGRKALDLSATEFELLAFFMRHPGQVLSTEQLLQKVWGYDSPLHTKTIKVHIANLRKKIETDPSRPQIIATLRGVGYRFEETLL